VTARSVGTPRRSWQRRAAGLAVAIAATLLATAATRDAGPGGADGRGVAASATTELTGDGHFTARVTLLDSGRGYVLHGSVDREAPRPLVVALHGLAHTPTSMAAQTGLTAFADAHGFTVAYGGGTGGGRWNAGSCCGPPAAGNVDDVGYLRHLVADAVTRTRVDPARVYVVGYSNGGMMAFRAACEAPDVFAAAAVVAGALLVDCPAGADVLHLHSLTDRSVPYWGGVGYEGVSFPPVWSEPLRMPADALYVAKVVPSGHGWPASANADLWEFLAGRRR
jgi:poly(3-hydroxybutyrate) depolymerase